MRRKSQVRFGGGQRRRRLRQPHRLPTLLPREGVPANHELHERVARRYLGSKSDFQDFSHAMPVIRSIMELNIGALFLTSPKYRRSIMSIKRLSLSLLIAAAVVFC